VTSPSASEKMPGTVLDLLLFGCLLGQVRTTQRGCSERERKRDRGPSSVGSEPLLHDARTRGEWGESGDRHEG